MVGMNIRVATPKQFEPAADIVEQANKIAAGKSEVRLTDDPIAAVKGSDVLYTDVWASMGQEEQARTRIPLFQPYQVNEDLLSYADSNAIVLHCLPAHRGEEISDGAIEGHQSRVWDQAENRMHAQKALLASVLGAD
jgi:ornithine carbamoyltransferase